MYPLISLVIYLSIIRTELQDMKFKVANLTNENQNLVILNADKNTSHGYVMSVLDVLKSIDSLKIAISTKSVD